MTEKPKNQKNRVKAVFSAKLAGALIDRGFEMIDKCRNYTNPKLWVYYFEDTDALQQAWSEIVGGANNDR